ncbi:MAG: hypothetical protein GY913_07270 [Proteobacteria bacterium]|nr:hypothetical protein [Pseudomonadota bacterium]MCP4916709.1 hypothetical protein [Pseudomonadota bacterium]
MILLLLACDGAPVLGEVGDLFDSSVDSDPTSIVPGVGEGLCRLELACSASIPDEPKIPCSLRVEDDQGVQFYDGPAGVEQRGRSSGGFPKPQYAAELRDTDEESTDADLLGMGSESDWVLNGAYIDRAFVRNKLAYDLFQSWGGDDRWAPESRACTLSLNDEERGIYFLVERVKRDDSRIQIASNGFVFKLDDQTGLVDWSAVGHGGWVLTSPSQPTDDDVTDATAWATGWRDAIQSDPASIGDWIDIDSAIDFLILQELMKNNDAYYLSVHVWKERDGLGYFAPWDLDLTLGQPTYNNNVSPEEWVAYRPLWVSALAETPGFDERLEARWFELRQGELDEDILMARLESQLAMVEPAIEENYDIWAWDEIDFLDGTLPIVEDHDAEVEKIRAWIPDRLTWIDENIADY